MGDVSRKSLEWFGEARLGRLVHFQVVCALREKCVK